VKDPDPHFLGSQLISWLINWLLSESVRRCAVKLAKGSLRGNFVACNDAGNISDRR